ncbi:MAG: MMPL family transporter [Candidatus Aminicenantes bacterium]|nr:MMPL family transporter [Candidatus Aminicenantes bacterium]
MIARWSRWVVGHRCWVIGLSLVLTVVALSGMRRLYFSNKLMEWLPKDDPQIARHMDVSEKFSINNLVMILIRPKQGVFRADFLCKVKALTDRLKEAPGLTMVTSISNASDIRKIPGGIEVANLLDRLPQDSRSMAELKNKVLTKDIFRNRVVSGNGEWLALSAYINSNSDQIRVVAEILIPEAEKAFAGEGECLFTGMPAETYFINQFVGRDLATLVPIALLLILAILFFSFHSWKGVVFPILVVVVSTIWLFGLIGFLGTPLTIVSPVIPVVIIALGSAYGIHVLNRLIIQVAEGGRNNAESIMMGTRIIFVPLVLAGCTDIFGFLTFNGARLRLIADFGLFTAIGLLLAMIVALALVPALASFIDFNRLQQEREGHSMTQVLLNWGSWVIRRCRLLLIISLGVFTCFAFAVTLLQQEVSFAKFYTPSSLPRRSMEAANAHFEGAYPVALSIETDRVRTSANLRVLRRLQNFMYSLPGTSQPFAVTDFIQELNWQLNDRYAIPDRDAAVGNLWFFVEGRDELSQLLTADNRQAVIFAKISNPFTAFNKKLYAQIKSFLDQELRLGYVSYQRRSVAPAQQQELYAAQASFLSQELAWLAQRYAPGHASRAQIEAIMVAGPWQELPFVQIREPVRAILWNYIAAPDFEFELSLVQKKRFMSSLMAALEKGAGPEELKSLMPVWLPAGSHDNQVEAELAETLYFKVNEANQQRRVDAMWQRLAQWFGNTDLNFEKKAKAVLYDLTAGMVVLPQKGVRLPHGRRLAIERIDQTGYPLMLSKMDYFLFKSLIQTILWCYLLTVVFMTLMRRSVPLGLISTLPIIFTSVVMFGLLALIGIPLDYATMMIGGVSIGVGIDYTIHFIHGYVSELDAGRSAEEAIRRAFLDKGKAILTNAISVMAGFAVLLLSSLLPLRNFAWAMVCSMFLSALAALTLLPASLLVFNPKIKNKRRKHVY